MLTRFLEDPSVLKPLGLAIIGLLGSVVMDSLTSLTDVADWMIEIGRVLTGLVMIMGSFIAIYNYTIKIFKNKNHERIKRNTGEQGSDVDRPSD